MDQRFEDFIVPESIESAYNGAVEIPSNQFTVRSRSRVNRFTSKLEMGTVFLKRNKTKLLLGAGGVLTFLALIGEN